MRPAYSISLLLIISFTPVFSLANPEKPIKDTSSWAFSAMASWYKPSNTKFNTYEETEEDASKRYNEISKAAYKIAFDPNEKPLFSGENGRSKTYILMLSNAASESHFRADVDFGDIKSARGDGGRSWCLMQIKLSKEKPNGKTQKRILIENESFSYSYDGETGWGGEDLVHDRTKCFRAGLHMMRDSIKRCSSYPFHTRLSGYISGPCYSRIGMNKSILRFRRALSWISNNPPVSDDSVILEEFPMQQPFVSLGG